MTACGAVGALMVGGRVVGQIRCSRELGHDAGVKVRLGTTIPPELRGVEPIGYEHGANLYPGTPHGVTLEWTPEADPDLDLFDPGEHFDVDVPLGESEPILGYD